MLEIRAILMEHSGAINAMTFSSDRKRLATGGADGIVRTWNLDTISVDDNVTEELITEADQFGRDWPKSSVSAVTFSTDGSVLAAATGNAIYLLNLATRQLIAHLEGHSDQVSTIIFSPDGRLLASGARDGSAKLWRVKDGHALFTFNEFVKGVRVLVAFSPDGETMAAAGAYISEWVIDDLYRKSPFYDLEPDLDDEEMSVARNKEFQRIREEAEHDPEAAGDAVLLWNVQTGDEIEILGGNRDTRDFIFLGFKRNNKTVTTVGCDDYGEGCIDDWDLKSALSHHRHQIERCHLFCPKTDGGFLIAGDSGISAYDPAYDSHQLGPVGYASCSDHRAERLTAIAHSPCDNLLATAGTGGSVMLWNISGLEYRRRPNRQELREEVRRQLDSEFEDQDYVKREQDSDEDEEWT